MGIPDGHKYLENVAIELQGEIDKGNKPSGKKQTVRQLLDQYGYSRRGAFIVGQIRNQLDKLNLRTIPEFGNVYIDAEISIELDSTSNNTIAMAEGPSDPTVRISALGAANREPVFVFPDKELSEAVTIMLCKDFSQLPVAPNNRDLRGVISWNAIGRKLSLNQRCEYVRDCMEPARIVSVDTPLLDAIGDISNHGYVLVRGKENKVQGIVTAADIGEKFIQLMSPFLILGEIEAHLRRLVHQKFELEVLKSTSAENQGSRIEGPANLTLGEFLRLFEDEEHWKKLDLGVDRVLFVKLLDSVRVVRNSIMHFSPDELDPEEMAQLEELVRLLRHVTPP